MSHYAEIQDGVVVRVVVCDDPAWLVASLGGTWEETKYSDPVEQYAGIGYRIDRNSKAKFARDWKLPQLPEQAYPAEAEAFHNGAIWESTVNGNTKEPGVANWKKQAV